MSTFDPAMNSAQTFTHDLRTPLTAIQGCLELLNQGGEEDFSPRAKRLIKVAARNTTRAMDLVNDLLDSTKAQAGKMELNAGSLFLSEIFETVGLDIEGWVEEYGIKIYFAPTTLSVQANKKLLVRILINLISNAIKATANGGNIVVQAARAGNMVEISVQDQGHGIEADLLEEVFERFHQLSSSTAVSGGSSGLGLSICREFVFLHGGKIWVTSTVGQGSVFHFTLPAASI